MNPRDTPPGHRRYRFGSLDADRRICPWVGEPGDVIAERGPRIGVRYWLVVDVEPLAKWATVLVRSCHVDEAIAEADDGAGCWYMADRHIDPIPPGNVARIANLTHR